MAVAVAVGDDNAAVVPVGQALQGPGREERHAFRCVGRVGEDQIGAAGRRVSQPETEVADEAADVEAQARRPVVDVLQGPFVDVRHDDSRARRDLPDRQGCQIMVAHAQQDGVAQVISAVKPQRPAYRCLRRRLNVIELGHGRRRPGDDLFHDAAGGERVRQPLPERIREPGRAELLETESLPVGVRPAGRYRYGSALAGQVTARRGQHLLHGLARQRGPPHQLREIRRPVGKQAEQLAQPPAVRPVGMDQGGNRGDRLR